MVTDPIGKCLPEFARTLVMVNGNLVPASVPSPQLMPNGVDFREKFASLVYQSPLPR